MKKLNKIEDKFNRQAARAKRRAEYSLPVRILLDIIESGLYLFFAALVLGAIAIVILLTFKFAMGIL